MLRLGTILVLVVFGATAPASAQSGRPLAGPGVPSFSPGVPSYNPGVPGQVPSTGFGNGQWSNGTYGRTNVTPRYANPQIVYPYGYGYGATPIIVSPRRLRSMADDPRFDDPPF